MKKTEKRYTKIILFTFAIIIALLLCLFIVLCIISDKKWHKGIFLLDNAVSINADSGSVQMEVSAIVIGKNNYERLKNGKLEVELRKGDLTYQFPCKFSYYIDEGKYYRVVLDLYPKLEEGKYDFDEIKLFDGDTCISSAGGTTEITMQEQYESRDCKFYITGCYVTEEQFMMIYEVENTGTDEIQILSFDGSLHISDSATLTVVNNVDISEGSIDLLSAVKYTAPITLQPQKMASFIYTVPLTEKDCFTNIYVQPRITCRRASENSNFAISTVSQFVHSFMPLTKEQVIEYISNSSDE